MADLRSLMFTIGFKGDDSGIKKMDSAADQLKNNVGKSMKSMASDSESAAGQIKSKTGSALDGVKSKLNSVDSASRESSISVMGIAKALGLVALASAGINLIKGSLDSAFNRMDTMAQFERTMTAITGSSDTAAVALDQLKGITKGTAYGLDVAAKATQDFVTRGMSVEDATKSVGAWADAVAFYGKGTNEELSNVSDAIAKMRTKGTVEMDQLNRLFDSGIDAVGMYAKANNMSSSEVQDALSKGQLSADDFLNSVENAMQTGAGGVLNVAGAAKEAGASWQGTFDNMKAAVTRGMIGVVESIDQALADNGLPTMKEMVTSVGAKFEEFGEKIGPIISGAIGWFVDFIEKVKPFAPVIVGIAAAFGAYQIAMTLGSAATTIATAAQWALNAAMTANPIGIIVMAIIGLIAGIVYLWNTNEGFRNAVIAIWDNIKIAFSAAWDWIKGVWEAVQPFFSALWEGIKLIFAGVVAFIQDPLGVAWEGIKAIWGLAVEWFTGIVTGIAEKFSGISDAIKNAFTAGIDFIKGLPEKFVEWGKDMIQGMIDGIKQKAKDMLSAVETIGDGIKSFLGFSRPDKGSLHYYEEWMPHFMQGLTSGIYDNMHLVKNAVSSLTNSMGMDINGTISSDERGGEVSGTTATTSGGGGGTMNFSPQITVNVNGGGSVKESFSTIEQQLNLFMDEYAQKMALRNPKVAY